MTVLLAALVLAVALVAVAVSRHARKFWRRHGGWAAVVTRALLTGHHLDGIHRCDKGWFRWGVSALPQNRRHSRAVMTWWVRAPRLLRVLAAWTALAALVLAVDGLATAPALTVTALAVAGSAGVAVAGVRSARRLATSRHRREVVGPLAAALASAPACGLGADASVIGLRVNQLHELSGYNRKIAHLSLPPGFAGLDRERQAIETVIAARLPVASPQFRWQLGHPPALAVFTAPPPPPAVLLLAAAAARMDQPAGRYYLGQGGGGRHYSLDTSTEDPHVAINARSRKGKTNVLSCVIAQGLRRGEEFWTADVKMVSLSHFLGVPGFVLANDPDNPGQMAALVLGFAAAMREARRTGDASVHRTLVIEEINSFSPLMNRWHGGLVKGNPVMQAVADILHMGGQFNHRVLLTGQNLTQDALWGLRHQFGTVLLTGYTPAQWKFITGDTAVPEQPGQKGRMYLCRNGGYQQVQVPAGDPRPGHGVNNDLCWRAFALAGRVAGAWQAQPAGPDQPGWPAWPQLGPGHDPLADPALPRVLIGVPAAAAYLGVSANAFELARKRHGPIPGEFAGEVPGHHNAAGRRDERLKPCWARADLDAWWSQIRAGV